MKSRQTEYDCVISGGRKGVGEGEEGEGDQGGGDLPGRQCSSALGDAPGLQPPPGLQFVFQSKLQFVIWYIQEVKNLTVEDCELPKCEEESVKFAEVLATEGGDLSG